MAKRPSQDTWLTARQRWEADPTESFESISRVVGVSRVAVSKRADKEKWSRPTNLRQINEKAQLQADAKVTPKPSEVSGATAKSTEQAAVDIRADVLEHHRVDWIEHRGMFSLGAIRENFDVGKQAKISAEMLLLRQKGERAAYGMTDADAGDGDKIGRELTDIERAARVASILERARRAKEAASK